MAGKIRVYGKAQNRTVLGIMHAYVTMYPQATLDDLRKAFPSDLCPDSGTRAILFAPLAEAQDVNEKANMSLFFVKPDETLTMGNGEVVALAQVWSKSSFERAVAHAKLYDIEIAEFEKGQAFQKGGFRLECLNGYVPPMPPKEPAKKNLLWLWILLGLLALGGILWFAFGGKKTEVIEKEVIVEKEIIVRDTVYVQQIEDIERSFNAAQFEQGKAILNDDAKLALHDLAKIMNQNQDLRLCIEGHTSAEGDAASNQKLSEDRAQAAVDFLVNKEGIDASRLTAVGYGSSKPISENLEENRRIEFIIEK